MVLRFNSDCLIHMLHVMFLCLRLVGICVWSKIVLSELVLKPRNIMITLICIFLLWNIIILSFVHLHPPNMCLILIAQEHWNYFGADENLGPVAVSIRREKPEEIKENGSQYSYRIIFRTSEVSDTWAVKK